MRLRQLGIAGLILLSQAIWATASTNVLPGKKAEPAPATVISLDSISPQKRDQVRQLLEKPVLAVKGPTETFFAQPEHYQYFLEHPDRAVVAWRRVGAKCVSITERGQGLFVWADDQGSEMIWETVFQGPGVRVWYAEGKVRPAALMPLVSVRGLVVMRHSESKTPDGASVITHQADLFAMTDSKTAATVTRLLGPSANRMAEQGLGQLQLFFSALCGYLDRHPEQATKLLKRGD